MFLSIIISVSIFLPNKDDNEYGNEDDPEENDDIKRSKMAVNAVNTYFYRHHYLSIIQEEEENSVNEATPPSSRTNSRPSSIYGLNPAAIQKAYKEYKVGFSFVTLSKSKTFWNTSFANPHVDKVIYKSHLYPGFDFMIKTKLK